MITADCKSCNKQAEQWKTAIDLLCLNQEEWPAEVGKIIRFICGKSIVVFHCSAYLLQDFCNLLYITAFLFRMKLHFAHTSQVKCNLNPANGWYIAKDHRTGVVCINKSNASIISTAIAQKGV